MVGAMGQKAAAAARRTAVLQPAILKSDRLQGLFSAGLDLPRRVKVSPPQLTARTGNMHTAQPFAMRACQS